MAVSSLMTWPSHGRRDECPTPGLEEHAGGGAEARTSALVYDRAPE
ncbi:hypothetical protein [Nocardia sp. bgisy118]